MFDSKIFLALAGIMAIFVALFNVHKINSHEGFLGNLPSMTWKVDREVGTNKGDLYSIPGTYQSILNPRFSNTDYGANIRYNMPSYENQAVPCEPLTFGKIAQRHFPSKESYCGGGPQNMSFNTMANLPVEGYASNYASTGPPAPPHKKPHGPVPAGCCRGSGVPTCNKGGGTPPALQHFGAPLTPAGYAVGNFNAETEKAYKAAEYPDVSSMLPVGDMTTLNALGQSDQPIIYDRYMFANRNSRLKGRGDPIRGDLAVVPCATGWFRPSVQPNIDLQQSALNVMGGSSEAADKFA